MSEVTNYTVNSDKSVTFDYAGQTHTVNPLYNGDYHPVSESEAAQFVQRQLDNPQKTSEQIAMDELRFQRDQLLASTDWWMMPDRTATQEQIDYRQALRDITSQTPSFDDEGNLVVSWPVKPAS